MPYVPKYRRDIFVSFANNDNAAEHFQDQWVRRFVEHLKIGIKNWLGNADELDIFFEKESMDGRFRLPMFLDNARDSAVFVAVISPSYVRRDWPLDELSAFCERGDNSDRLFTIECWPVDDRSLLPGELSDIIPTAFFVQDKDSRAPRRMTPEDDGRLWKNRIGELAWDIAKRLRSEAQVGLAGSARVVPDTGKSIPISGDQGSAQDRTILLAQATDDLIDEYDDVRRFLTQAGFRVLPGQGVYPKAGELFKAAFNTHLESANFYVQLLGAVKSRRDHALPMGYARFQFETAKGAANARSNLKTFFWRPIYLRVNEIKHDDVSLLSDEAVVAMTLEAFKKEIQSTISRVHHQKYHVTVFINAAPTDSEIATAVSDECFKQGFISILAPSESSALEFFRQVNASFGVCNAYFLVFGKADPLWAVRQGGYFTKISAHYSEAELPKVIAILDGPPEGKSPPPIRLPRSRIIDCRKSLDPMRQVLAELRP